MVTTGTKRQVLFFASRTGGNYRKIRDIDLPVKVLKREYGL